MSGQVCGEPQGGNEVPAKEEPQEGTEITLHLPRFLKFHRLWLKTQEATS
jgi:hypothetical protein